MRELAERWKGIARVIATEVPLPATAPTLVAPFNFDRIFLLLANGDQDVIAVWPFSTVSGVPATFRGIRLAAVGGLVSFNAPTDAVMPCHEWWAYPTTAPRNLLVLEVVLDAPSKG